MKKKSSDRLSDELLAAFLDANTSASETMSILEALNDDSELREIFKISQLVDDDIKIMNDNVDVIPMTAVAATCQTTNICSIECEKYILNKRKISFDDKQILDEAVSNKWKKNEGTPLYNIGRCLEKYGLSVTRHYHCNLTDIAEALRRGDDVIAAVDGGELIGDVYDEFAEDMIRGHNPDHAVIILNYDEENKIITIFDPDSANAEDVYHIDQFSDAWADSKNYLITINTKEMKEYNPKPIDLSDVILTDDLTELREAIAENAHDIWALARKKEGWTYGPKRDDDKKQNPCMMPYCDLPESEKEYDREMAMQTIKLMYKLGYDLVKRKDTELYKTLLNKIKNTQIDFYCPHCKAEDKMTPIYKHQVFCSVCGHRLDIDWSLFE